MTTTRHYYHLGERCAWIGMVTNFFLCFVKLFAGFWGNSNALIADGVDALSDLVSTGIVLIGFKIAKKPPDEEHPYGHGRAETIATKTIAVILILFGLQIGYNSLKALFAPNLAPPSFIALIAAAFSIIIKESLFKYTLRIGNELSSSSLIADAWHHKNDAYSSIAALIGILGAIIGFPCLDPLAGIFISILIIKVGGHMFHKAYDELMNGVIKSEIIDKIRDVIKNVSGVKSIKELKAHKMGLEINIDLIINVDGGVTVDKGHDICNLVEEAIRKEISSVRHIMIHVNPSEVNK
ncbi:MAG: cation diffusion facilitator family transporter [bacterium]|nr:cation diffusion facilitator family transporter [bacterium]